MPRHVLACLLVWGVFTPATKAAPAIGRVTDSRYGREVRKLLDSETVDARSTGTQLVLDNGGRIWLAPGGRATFYRDHAVLERGGARVEVPQGYAFHAGEIKLEPRGADSRATVAVLARATVDVALWRGSMRVATGDRVLLETIRAGDAFEFAPQGPGSGTGPGTQGGGPRSGGPGGCQCDWCPQGPITVENGKTYITCELSGAKIELQVPTQPRPGMTQQQFQVMANQIKQALQQAEAANKQAADAKQPPPKFIICGDVVKKADATNKGLVLATWNVVLLPKVINTGSRCFIISRDKSGRYFAEEPKTGLRWELKPGIQYGDLNDMVKKGKDGKCVDLRIYLQPPQPGEDFPVMLIPTCFRGKITCVREKGVWTCHITDDITGVKVELRDPNAWKYQDQRREVCGWVDLRANKNNENLVITPESYNRTPDKPPQPKTITGIVTKDGKTYYITDPVTGIKIEITPDDDLSTELDKRSKENEDREKAKLPPLPSTITGTIKKPDKTETYPTIGKPKQVSELPVHPGNGPLGRPTMVTATGIVATAVLVTLLVQHNGGTMSPPAP